MEGSRLRILNLLVQRKQATVDQLSREMGLASATVRRHLDILQKDSLVSFDQIKKKTGRPEHTYFLTEVGQESLPKGYSQLLGRMLETISNLSREEVASRDGRELLQLVFQELAQEVADAAKDDTEWLFEERLARAMEVLQNQKFRPSLEREPGQLRLRLLNCPFRSVALSNPVVCEYDEFMLTAIFGTEVVRGSCIGGGDQGCCYLVPLPGQKTR